MLRGTFSYQTCSNLILFRFIMYFCICWFSGIDSGTELLLIQFVKCFKNRNNSWKNLQACRYVLSYLYLMNLNFNQYLIFKTKEKIVKTFYYQQSWQSPVCFHHYFWKKIISCKKKKDFGLRFISSGDSWYDRVVGWSC
jgi:hypothetical protein